MLEDKKVEFCVCSYYCVKKRWSLFLQKCTLVLGLGEDNKSLLCWNMKRWGFVFVHIVLYFWCNHLGLTQIDIRLFALLFQACYFYFIF